MHLSMLFLSSFNQSSTQYSFKATGCFPITIVKTMDSSERGMSTDAMTRSSILGKIIGQARISKQ